MNEIEKIENIAYLSYDRDGKERFSMKEPNKIITNTIVNGNWGKAHIKPFYLIVNEDIEGRLSVIRKTKTPITLIVNSAKQQELEFEFKAKGIYEINIVPESEGKVDFDLVLEYEV